MASRVGIDLVDIQQVRDAIASHGDRYLQRIYCEQEVADCRASSGVVDAERLAARFAAKEAAIKVLRPASGGINWRDIQIARAPGGWVTLELTRTAAAAATAQDLVDFDVSLTHEAGFAGAVVVAQAAA